MFQGHDLHSECRLLGFRSKGSWGATRRCVLGGAFARNWNGRIHGMVRAKLVGDETTFEKMRLERSKGLYEAIEPL